MKTHIFTKRIAYYFCLTLVLCFISEIQVQAEEINAVSIDKSQLCAGIPLQAILESEGAQNIQYRWYIDSEMISDSVDSSYLPTEEDYEHWIKVEVFSDGKMLGSDNVYFSKLPVVYIDTADGGTITSKTEYKDGSMYIQGNEEYPSQYDGEIEIKGRGNSSWSYPQKPYKIKLDKSTDLFGFGKNKHWVLISPYLDQSLMRNKLAYDLSGELGLIQMQNTWVDVILNGAFIGNYALCESIRVADSRIPIFNWGNEIEKITKKICGAEDVLTDEDQEAMKNLLEEDLNWITSGEFEYEETTYTISDYYLFDQDISGGYVFELSEEYDEPSKFITSGGMKVMLNTPEYLYTNDKMFRYVKDYWQQFEDGIRSVDGYNKEGQHYQDLADFDSMIAYWLTMEIMGNNDAYYKSRYAYKDSHGLLTFGPAWDFDWGCASVTVSASATSWKLSSGTLWKDFIDDPYFCVKAAEKYWSVRDYLEEITRDGGMIDSYYEYLYESGKATDVRYPNKYLYSNTPRRDFETDVQVLKTYLADRIVWLDKHFASTSSIIASLHMTASANPYTRSEEKLSISLPGTVEDSSSAPLKADGILTGENKLDVELAVKEDDTTSLNVYVNGCKYAEGIAIADGEAFVSIDASKLMQGGVQNVLAFIGKDAKGEVSCTNFATVIAEDIPQEDIDPGDEPDGNTQEPPVTGDEPDGNTEEPPVTGDEPGGNTEEPPVTGGEPGGNTQAPPVTGGGAATDRNTGDHTDGNTAKQPATGNKTTVANTPAAKGTVLSVAAKKCRVLVTSSDANHPSVAYKGTTDQKASKITIPDLITVNGITYKVSSIADNAFAGNKKISKVIIGKNVISIGKNAFRNCSRLKTVEIKTAILNKIGANAFRGSKKLTKITLKTTKLTKKSIGKNALQGTNKKLRIKAPGKMCSKYKAYFMAKGNKRVRVKA